MPVMALNVPTGHGIGHGLTSPLGQYFPTGQVFVPSGYLSRPAGQVRVAGHTLLFHMSLKLVVGTSQYLE